MRNHSLHIAYYQTQRDSQAQCASQEGMFESCNSCNSRGTGIRPGLWVDSLPVVEIMGKRGHQGAGEAVSGFAQRSIIISNIHTHIQ